MTSPLGSSGGREEGERGMQRLERVQGSRVTGLKFSGVVGDGGSQLRGTQLQYWWGRTGRLINVTRVGSNRKWLSIGGVGCGGGRGSY